MWDLLAWGAFALGGFFPRPVVQEALVLGGYFPGCFVWGAFVSEYFYPEAFDLGYSTEGFLSVGF